MSKRQLALLFLLHLCLFTMGYGLLPLMPVYATRLGLSPTVVGYYLSLATLATACGSLSAGWAFERVSRPKSLLFAIGALSIPGILLMGPATRFWQLAILTAVVWFCIGIGMALVNILAGLSAEKHERGRIFGILSSASGFGGLIGGLTMGRVADRWGFPIMFVAAASVMVVWILIAGLVATPRSPAASRPDQAVKSGAKPVLSTAFYLLFVANLMASIASAVRTLGSPLVMNNLGYSAAAISSTQAVLGSVAIPLPFFVGWLSDRVGRRWLIAVAFLAASAALLTLANGTVLWHFFVAAGLVSVFLLGSPLGSAMTADLLPKESIPRGISLYSSSTWLGGVMGFAAAGLAIQRFGMIPTFLAGAALPLVGVALVAAIRRPRPATDAGLGDRPR